MRHDWQAALAPAYLRFAGEPRPATVLTIHNLAFQGQFAAGMLRRARPAAARPSRSTGVEYYGGVGFLKAGLHSPTGHHGQPDLCPGDPDRGRVRHGPDGLLRTRAADLRRHRQRHRRPSLEPGDRPAPCRPTYDAEDARRPRRQPRAVEERFGLDADAGAAASCVVSRLTWQKGLDLLLDAAADACSRHGGQLARPRLRRPRRSRRRFARRGAGPSRPGRRA